MFFPVMIEIENKNILVVGAGEIAFRKAKTMLEFGASITILSPEIKEEFELLKSMYKDQITFIYKMYDKEYIKGKFMVIAATSDKDVNKTIAKDCKVEGILVNSVSARDDSDFINPSIIRNDNLTISISTGGCFPYLSKKIRMDMGKNYSKYDLEYMDTLEEIRCIILEKHPSNWKEIMDEAISLNIKDLKEFKEKLDDK